MIRLKCVSRSENQNSLIVFLFRWHPLKCKPGKNKTEYRGELEVNKSINSFRIRVGQSFDHDTFHLLLSMVKTINIMPQVKLGFTVKASTTVGNSTADLAKKNKGSVASITKVVHQDSAC